jgi:GNAT superfamily N-acetyltransferase
MNLTFQLIAEEDLDAVMTIAHASGLEAWGDRSMILRYLNCHGTVGLIARCRDVAVGTMFFTTRRSWIELETIQVLTDCRRQGVGRTMLHVLTGGAWIPTVYQHVTAGARESNYAGCAFLEACGFSVNDALENSFWSTAEEREDGLVFCFRLKPKALAVSTQNQFTQPLGDPQ